MVRLSYHGSRMVGFQCGLHGMTALFFPDFET